jgi:hypothetical protein
MPNAPTDEITAQQALAILGYSDPSTISAMVRDERLKPSRQLPGKTGARLFWRSDVIALAEKLAAERAERNAALEARLREAKAEMAS